MDYSVLAYYNFVSIDDPKREVIRHKKFLATLNATARIYISESGINSQMSILTADLAAYQDWLAQSPYYTMPIKIHTHHEHVFPRLTVKYRKQLVAIDETIDLSKTGVHLSPKEWREKLESNKEHVLIDVRNDYEWKIGHFKGSELPPCETFREFTEYAEELKTRIDPEKTEVLMCCTGGIRCELYSSLLLDLGIKQVFQLDGGLINYGLKEGNAHYDGKIFVFDDRLAIPMNPAEPEKTNVIANCHRCNASVDTYYNCANMDCNRLFICCQDCIKELKGCCKEDCTHSSRLRPYNENTVHKPFRRQHHYREAILEHNKCTECEQ